jgi:hypothetical protein
MRRASDVTRDASGVTARLPYSEACERELRALAAAEAECCPFLDIEVRRDEHELHLTVSAPPEARDIIESMFGHRP